MVADIDIGDEGACCLALLDHINLVSEQKRMKHNSGGH